MYFVYTLCLCMGQFINVIVRHYIFQMKNKRFGDEKSVGYNQNALSIKGSWKDLAIRFSFEQNLSISPHLNCNLSGSFTERAQKFTSNKGRNHALQIKTLFIRMLHVTNMF